MLFPRARQLLSSDLCAQPIENLSILSFIVYTQAIRSVDRAILGEHCEPSHQPLGKIHGIPSILGYAFRISFVAGFNFFVLSFVVLGIIPVLQLRAEIRRITPHAIHCLTRSDEHGRAIYGRVNMGIARPDRSERSPLMCNAPLHPRQHERRNTSMTGRRIGPGKDAFKKQCVFLQSSCHTSGRQHPTTLTTLLTARGVFC